MLPRDSSPLSSASKVMWLRRVDNISPSASSAARTTFAVAASSRTLVAPRSFQTPLQGRNICGAFPERRSAAPARSVVSQASSNRRWSKWDGDFAAARRCHLTVLRSIRKADQPSIANCCIAFCSWTLRIFAITADGYARKWTICLAL